jgi:hypothetical protein
MVIEKEKIQKKVQLKIRPGKVTQRKLSVLLSGLTNYVAPTNILKSVNLVPAIQGHD